MSYMRDLCTFEWRLEYLYDSTLAQLQLRILFLSYEIKITLSLCIIKFVFIIKILFLSDRNSMFPP